MSGSGGILKKKGRRKGSKMRMRKENTAEDRKTREVVR